MTTNLRQQICGILATGKFTARQVADQLGVQTRAEVKQVRDAILELAREDKVGRAAGDDSATGPTGKYWRLAEVTVSVQEKIWRAMCLKSLKGQPWTHAEVARLAEATRDYVRRYSRFLEKCRYVQEVGLSRRLFQVWPGKEKEQAPHWNRRAEQRQRPAAPPPPVALPSRADKLGQALEVLEVIGRGLVEVPEAIERAREIIRKMQGELLSLEGRGDGDPGEPADHHQS
jgi:hypothetical protein